MTEYKLVPAGFRVMWPTSSAPREGDSWEVYAPCGSGGIVSAHEVNDWVVRRLLDALAIENAAAPVPEQQVEQEYVPDDVFADEFTEWWEEHGQFCRAGGGNYERTFAFQAWRHLYPRLMRARTAPPAAPDVSGLVEALEKIAQGEIEEDGFLVAMAGEECMQVAHDALSAHREQQGGNHGR